MVKLRIYNSRIRIIGSLKHTCTSIYVDYFHSGALMTFRRDKSSFWVRRANPFPARRPRGSRHEVLTDRGIRLE